MVKWLRGLVGGDGAEEDDGLLSPNCELLARSYDFEAGSVLSLHIDVAEGRVVVEMDLPVLDIHPAHSPIREVRRVVTATFQGALEATATLGGRPMPRGEQVDLEYEHMIDEFYISATCPWSYKETSYHAHVLWLLAEGLVLAFPFADVRCKEVLEED